MLRPTPGDPRGAEQHHWNTGAKENQQAKKVTDDRLLSALLIPDYTTYLPFPSGFGLVLADGCRQIFIKVSGSNIFTSVRSKIQSHWNTKDKIT